MQGMAAGKGTDETKTMIEEGIADMSGIMTGPTNLGEDVYGKLLVNLGCVLLIEIKFRCHVISQEQRNR